jgi:hypothetical protein
VAAQIVAKNPDTLNLASSKMPANKTNRISYWLARIPAHPILVAAAPALFLLAWNIDQLRPTAAFRAILMSTAIGAAIFLLIRSVYKDWRKAGLVATLLFIFFFSYGQVYELVREQSELGWDVARHRYMLPIWIAAFVGVITIIRKLVADTGPLTTAFNFGAIVAILIPLGQIAIYQTRSELARRALESSMNASSGLELQEGQTPPDIYYIILDAYNRDDYLLAEYGFDNTPFLQFLEERGFYVARCSQSNYSLTQLSLPSSLNMNYIEVFGDNYRSGSTTRLGLDRLVKDSQVRRDLEALGYSFVAFETGFIFTEVEDADHYFERPKQGTLNAFFDFTGINGFEVMLIENSGARVLTDGATASGFLSRLLPDVNRPQNDYRDRTLFVLDQLELSKVPSIRGPKFTFVHLISPHYPYVIDREGGLVSDEVEQGDHAAYIDQVIYLNSRLETIIDGILRGSVSEPIIVLQADHGHLSEPDERMAILNAFYLPFGGSDELYPSISPVNTFRYIFNTYFGGELALLDDQSLFSTYQLPHDYEPVLDTRSGCTEG